jgi:RNA polymerase sigma-70 factor (ECF subfamily)
MAAIAAVHAGAASWDDTDWREIVGLDDGLVAVWPSPVVALNRAVAVGFAFGAQAGLEALDALARRAAARLLRLCGVEPRGHAASPR